VRSWGKGGETSIAGAAAAARNAHWSRSLVDIGWCDGTPQFVPLVGG